MDETIQKQIDTIVEDNLVRGYTEVSLPPDILASLESACEVDNRLKPFKRVRFTKQTPRKKRLINEAVIARYHKDLQNKELLSNEQLRKINIERGEWSKEKEERMTTLQEKSNTMMRDLYMDGMDHRETWIQEMLDAMDKYVELLDTPPENLAHLVVQEAKEALIEVFNRWSAYSPTQQAEYDTNFAASQKRETYSPDNDYQLLIDLYPNVESINLLGIIDERRYKLHKYTDLMHVRKELVDLQLQQTKIFAESVESRRDAAEELAKVYYLTERMEEGKPAGPLTATYDQMWDLPDELIQWIIVELYFFLNGVPEEARRYLAEWGFIPALPPSGAPQSSVASPEEQSSSSDIMPPTKTDVSSSESTPLMSSEIPS